MDSKACERRVICILSTSAADPSTEDVIEWLNAWKVPWVRLNGQALNGEGSVAFSLSRSNTSVSIKSGTSLIDPSVVKVVWYRRWAHRNSHREQDFFTANCKSHGTANVTSLARHIDKELSTLDEVIFGYFSTARWLSHPTSSKLNKLRVLQMAAVCGLDIPATIVATDRDRLLEFIRAHEKAITKPLGESLMYECGGESYASYTIPIDEADIEELPSSTFPMLLQEHLPKRYDIRVFYLDGRFYGMAIFSQTRAQTSVDFRRYTYERPVRNVPYDLHEDTAESLRKLMRLLNLQTGSIDLVKTTQGRTVFLEVNAVGQFGMVSAPCNYHLEREIAKALVRRWQNCDDHA